MSIIVQYVKEQHTAAMHMVYSNMTLFVEGNVVGCYIHTKMHASCVHDHH